MTMIIFGKNCIFSRNNKIGDCATSFNYLKKLLNEINEVQTTSAESNVTLIIV